MVGPNLNGGESLTTAEFVSSFTDAHDTSQTVGAFRVARVLKYSELVNDERELHYLLIFSSPDYSDQSIKSWELTVASEDFPEGSPWWPLSSARVLQRVLTPATCASNQMKRDLISAGFAADNDVHSVSTVSVL